MLWKNFFIKNKKEISLFSSDLLYPHVLHYMKVLTLEKNEEKIKKKRTRPNKIKYWKILKRKGVSPDLAKNNCN